MGVLDENSLNSLQQTISSILPNETEIRSLEEQEESCINSSNSSNSSSSNQQQDKQDKQDDKQTLRKKINLFQQTDLYVWIQITYTLIDIGRIYEAKKLHWMVNKIWN